VTSSVQVHQHRHFWRAQPEGEPATRSKNPVYVAVPKVAKPIPANIKCPTYGGLRVIALRDKARMLNSFSYAGGADLRPLVEPIPVPLVNTVLHLCSVIRDHMNPLDELPPRSSPACSPMVPMKVANRN
jgi:hypothetical protein